jgi:GNAT superfamily N-acetyltransferase
VTDWKIRSASVGEAAALTALAHRSKAAWGYDEAFMAAARAVLEIKEADIAVGRVWVAQDPERRLLGVASIGALGPRGGLHLDTLFVEPTAKGLGVGAALFHRAALEAARLGAGSLLIEADPNAAAFYARMGATLIGETPSEAIAGRLLPVLALDLGQAPSSRAAAGAK